MIERETNKSHPAVAADLGAQEEQIMKSLFTHQMTGLAVLAVFVFATLFTPATAEAKYRDNSDQLPGMDGPNPTPYIIAGGALIGGFVLYKVFSHKSDNDKKVQGPTDFSAPADGGDKLESDADATQDPDGAELSFENDQESRVKLYLDVTSDDNGSDDRGPAMDFSDLTVKVGLSLGF
jgi:hypothetical protein